MVRGFGRLTTPIFANIRTQQRNLLKTHQSAVHE